MAGRGVSEALMLLSDTRKTNHNTDTTCCYQDDNTVDCEKQCNVLSKHIMCHQCDYIYIIITKVHLKEGSCLKLF